MAKQVFVEEGQFGVLFFLIEELPPAAVPFQVTSRQVRPFDYGNLPTTVTTGIEPEKSLDAFKISSMGRAIQGREIEDLFYFDDVDVLMHMFMNIKPDGLRVFPYWIAGYLQSDYHDILTADNESPFGYLTPPLNFISIPYCHLEFSIRNPYKTETINPYISWDYAIYNVKYIVDPELAEALLTKRLRAPWFTIYGFKRFPYNFAKNMMISRPIPIVAKRPDIESIIEEWKALGQWT